MAKEAFREISGTGAATSGAERGARLPQFIGLKAPAGPKLDTLKAAVVCTGSVGTNLALHVARLQPEAMWCVDQGRLKPESVLTHPIVPADVGKPKALHTGRLAKAISPGTRVFAFQGPFELLPPTALLEADVVLASPDNLAAELAIGQWCLYHRKPLVLGQLHGESLVVHVQFFANRDGRGPCPACSFGQEEWRHVAQQTVFSCTGGERPPDLAAKIVPTTSLSSLCALAADLSVLQLVRFVLGLGAPVEDTCLEYSGFTHRTVVSPLQRNASCSCEHLAWTRVAAPRALAECSLRELAACAGRELGANGSLSFNVGGLVFAEAASCCGNLHAVGRFVAGEHIVGRCPTCGAALRPQPFFSRRRVPAAVVMPLVDRPLAQLGGKPARWVVVYGEDGGTLFV